MSGATLGGTDAPSGDARRRVGCLRRAFDIRQTSYVEAQPHARREYPLDIRQTSNVESDRERPPRPGDWPPASARSAAARLGARRFAACLIAALAFATTAPPSLHAQVPADALRPPSTLVRTGKWVALGVAAGTMALGIRAHNTADTDYDRLRAFCGGGGNCRIGTDGRYQDPGAESLYQEVVRGDRAARVWLIAGQTAIAGTVVLFVMDLSRRGRPGNEPFSGLVVAPGAYGSTRVGWQLPLP